MAMRPTDTKDFAAKFPDIAKLTTREAVLGEITASHKREMSGNNVQNMLAIGAMVEWAVINNLFPRRRLQEFIRQNVPYTYSYVALARRWHLDRDNIAPAIDWYMRENERRAETGFKFRTRDSQGIVFVRECLKAYEEAGYPKNGDSGDLAKVDQKYPMKPRGRGTVADDALTTERSRQRLEAIVLYCIAKMSACDDTKDDPICSQFKNVEEFTDWSTDALFSAEQSGAVEYMKEQIFETWADYAIPFAFATKKAQEAQETTQDVENIPEPSNIKDFIDNLSELIGRDLPEPVEDQPALGYDNKEDAIAAENAAGRTGQQAENRIVQISVVSWSSLPVPEGALQIKWFRSRRAIRNAEDRTYEFKAPIVVSSTTPD